MCVLIIRKSKMIADEFDSCQNKNYRHPLPPPEEKVFRPQKDTIQTPFHLEVFAWMSRGYTIYHGNPTKLHFLGVITQYNPYIGGFKTSFFMVLGSKGTLVGFCWTALWPFTHPNDDPRSLLDDHAICRLPLDVHSVREPRKDINRKSWLGLFGRLGKNRWVDFLAQYLEDHPMTCKWLGSPPIYKP